MKCLLLSVTFCVSFTNVKSKYCFWNTGCTYKYFSSGTPYNSVRGDFRDSVIQIPGCSPISIWGLYRHGKTRPESTKRMKDALSILNNIAAIRASGKSSLCAQDIDNLLNWTYSDLSKKSPGLTEEGYQEMFGIGKRLKQTFPKLLTNLEFGGYQFRSVSGPEYEETIKAFLAGTENDNLTVNLLKPGFDIIAPHLKCMKYQNYRKGPNSNYQAIRYLKSVDYLAAKKRVQKRLGIEYLLSDDNITALYELCRHSWSGIQNRPSPWCAIFTKDDLLVMEYIEDLKHYYKSGHGYPLNAKLGHFPMSDLYDTFVKAKSKNGRKITAYFTQSAATEMFYTSLGLFKDENPLNSLRRDSKRKWRASIFASYAANFVAVLNVCESGDFKVVFYLNEEPVKTLCEDSVCTWKDFEKLMKPSLMTDPVICDK